MSEYSERIQDLVNYLYSDDYRNKVLDFPSKVKFISAIKEHLDTHNNGINHKQRPDPQMTGHLYANVIGKVDSLEQLISLSEIHFIPEANEKILENNEHLPEQDRLFIKMGGL